MILGWVQVSSSAPASGWACSRGCSLPRGGQRGAGCSWMASGTCLDMGPAVGQGWGGGVSPAGQPSSAGRSRVHRSSRWGQALCIFSFLIGQKKKNMAKPRVSDFWVSGRDFLRVCDSVGTIITTILDHRCWLVHLSGNICQFESALLLKKYCV